MEGIQTPWNWERCLSGYITEQTLEAEIVAPEIYLPDEECTGVVHTPASFLEVE